MKAFIAVTGEVPLHSPTAGAEDRGAGDT